MSPSTMPTPRVSARVPAEPRSWPSRTTPSMDPGISRRGIRRATCGALGRTARRRTPSRCRPGWRTIIPLGDRRACAIATPPGPASPPVPRGDRCGGARDRRAPRDRGAVDAPGCDRARKLPDGDLSPRPRQGRAARAVARCARVRGATPCTRTRPAHAPRSGVPGDARRPRGARVGRRGARSGRSDRAVDPVARGGDRRRADGVPAVADGGGGRVPGDLAVHRRGTADPAGGGSDRRARADAVRHLGADERRSGSSSRRWTRCPGNGPEPASETPTTSALRR